MARADHTPLPSGRIQHGPAPWLTEEILGPQFDWDVEHLLGHYQWIELAQLAEYQRMGLVGEVAAADIHQILVAVTPGEVAAQRDAVMSDALFALERHVQSCLAHDAPRWHVDRSRNDVQACAQLMLAREGLLATVADLIRLATAARRVAPAHVTAPMPGHTQHQAAQVITPGFYLAGLAEVVITSAECLLGLFDAVNLCPLGAGAMAGLELPWDRDRLARLLGFLGPQPHALTCVASRAWGLRIGGELSALATSLSRFTTDLIYWSSSACRFIDLPDELAGISSAMPHKRNFPVLERIRGLSGHLPSLALDVAVVQRNTSYTNLVEVSKESARYFTDLFGLTHTMLVLLEQVLANLSIDHKRARSAAQRALLGTSSVANDLTLRHGIPARAAQVLVGAWVAAAAERGDPAPDAGDLGSLCAARGYRVRIDPHRVRELLDVDAALWLKQTEGSTNPDATRRMLSALDGRLDTASKGVDDRARLLGSARNLALARSDPDGRGQ
jgi:argininosuccinate lyase